MSGTISASVAPANIFNRSGTVATGGVAQVLMAANPQRAGFWIQNNSAGDLWIRADGTAAAVQPSLRIPPNSLYENPDACVPVTAISIFGATTGQTFTCQEWVR